MHLVPTDGQETHDDGEIGTEGVESASSRGSDAEGAADPHAARPGTVVTDSDEASEADDSKSAVGTKAAKGADTLNVIIPNNVRKIRIERMMSKAELARRANLSVLTIDRVEKGFGSRMNTKRKILEALGLSLADRVRVFGEEE